VPLVYIGQEKKPDKVVVVVGWNKHVRLQNVRSVATNGNGHNAWFSGPDSICTRTRGRQQKRGEHWKRDALRARACYPGMQRHLTQPHPS
jgi:hypothetical protein